MIISNMYVSSYVAEIISVKYDRCDECMNPSVKQFSIDMCGSLSQLIMEYVRMSSTEL